VNRGTLHHPPCPSQIADTLDESREASRELAHAGFEIPSSESQAILA
jgi:hypothetical protein